MSVWGRVGPMNVELVKPEFDFPDDFSFPTFVRRVDRTCASKARKGVGFDDSLN